MTSRVLTRAVEKVEPWLTEVRKIWTKIPVGYSECDFGYAT